ncbi:MAG: hypothetical protein QOI66_2806 [Myxococcales bacterium]|jgi:hypothetical protein|nr:hypothetical protein [Myxococcales bacterium]
MANFYKEKGMDATGYDSALNKQSLGVGGSSKIALFGGDTDGSPLKVTSNNPGVVDLDEQGALNPNVRVLTIIGRAPGTSMIEARTKAGAVWAYMQAHVTAVVAKLSREQRVAEAMRRAIPLLPGEAKDAIEAMVSPASIIIIAASLLLWAGSHAFGVGEIVDIVLMVGGFLMLGKSVLDLAEDLFKFAKLTVNGTTDAELDEAAKCFARVVVVGGIDLIMALLLRKSLKQIRARPSAALAPKGLLPVEPPPPINPGELFYKPKISRPLTLPSGSLGECSWYGDVYVTRAQTIAEQKVTLFHELGHSYFSPKFRYLRLFRARLKASAYWRSALLRYLEEALVEGFGQFKVNGLLSALKGVTFPIGPPPYGYVTVSELAAEGTALGTIVVGGLYLKVFLSKSPPHGLPPTPVQ